MKQLLLPLFILAAPIMAQERVLSLDYCADQYVMALAEPGHIIGLSPAADSEYSYLAERASGLSQLRPTGEEVLLAEPDIVIRQWGGGYNVAVYLERFGIPLTQISFGVDIESARTNLRSIAAALGETDKGEQLMREMDLRLARIKSALPSEARPPRALYVTPAGITTGSGTFVHEMMVAAGVINMGAEGGREGWLEINLEAIALNPPDLIVGAFFDLQSNHTNAWSVARHSFLREVMQETPTVLIPGSQIACATWFFVDAAEAIHEAALRWSEQQVASRR